MKDNSSFDGRPRQRNEIERISYVVLGHTQNIVARRLEVEILEKAEWPKRGCMWPSMQVGGVEQQLKVDAASGSSYCTATA